MVQARGCRQGPPAPLFPAFPGGCRVFGANLPVCDSVNEVLTLSFHFSHLHPSVCVRAKSMRVTFAVLAFATTILSATCATAERRMFIIANNANGYGVDRCL